MAANPISLLELEAYERKFLVQFGAWQTEVICRLDDAVRAVWHEQTAKPKRPLTAAAVAAMPSAQIPLSDSAGIRSLFKGIKTAKRLEKGAST